MTRENILEACYLSKLVPPHDLFSTSTISVDSDSLADNDDESSPNPR